ncbi:MAG: hypothetical protein V4819_07010 [Verrucomicrobiota bacterium]
MNLIIPTDDTFILQPKGPSWARRIALLAVLLLVAAGMIAPQLRAAPLYLDFATNGGVTTATGWTPVYQTAATTGITNVGGSPYSFQFTNIGAYQGGDATQTLTRSGFHNANNYATAKTFTLTGLPANKPVKLYACASWDGNGAGGYIVYGDTGATGVKAQTIGNPGTTGNLANLTLIGTATADGTGMVSGSLWGRNNATAIGNAEGQVGAFVFVPTQTITASAGLEGSISPAGAVDVSGGTNQSYTITANSGYHIADVLVDGVSVGAVADYTFTNVVADHTIAASFAIDTVAHTITASAGANGTISPSGATSAFEGTNKPFTITPDTGYHVENVLVDGISVGAVSNYTFTNVTASHTISASFAVNTYTITATAGAHGSISPAGATSVDYFGSQEFSIIPDEGYYVGSMVVDGAAVSPAEFHAFYEVTANHTISVTFDNRTRLYLDFAKTGSGYTNNWTPIFAAQQADTMINVADIGGLGYGFTFGHVASYDNNNANQSLTRSGFYNFGTTNNSHPFALTGLTPGQTVSLYACAAWDGNGNGAYVVYGDSGAAGKKAQTIGDPGNTPILENLTLIGTATVDVNGTVAGNMYGNAGVGIGGEGQLGGFVFAIEAPPVFAITASAGSNGTISPSGSVNVTSGSNQSFTITANSGYHIADVLVDGVSVGAVSNHTFNIVTAPHTISASFAVDTVVHTITASAGANGTISPSGGVSANAGVNKVFSIAAATGYHIADVLVDGSSVGAVSSHTFNNVSANHTIAASFAIDTFTITASAGANGSITPNGATSVNHDGSQSFTITPAPGYLVDDVTVDGVSIGAVSNYTFNNVTAAHSISASFDDRLKLKLDFTFTGAATTANWTPVGGNYVADTAVASAFNIDGLGYNFSIEHVGAYDNGQTWESLTRSGFYTYGNNTNAHDFTVTGLNAGQSVSLYACATWDGNARAGVVVFGDSGTAGVTALTVGDPGTSPTLANLTLIGTATADATGKVTGSLHGNGGVGSATEGQVGGFVFAISAGGTPPTSGYENWATSAPNNLTGADALPGSDPDLDGVSNKLEFALDGSPISGASSGLSFGKEATVASEPNVLTLTIAVRDTATFSASGNSMKSTLVDGITYIVEASNTLGDWGGPVVTEVTGADATNIQSGLPSPGSGWSYKTFRTDGSSTSDSSDFIRVGVE